VENASNPPKPASRDRKPASRSVNNLIVGAFLAALLIAGVWLFNAISASQKAQECLESRRRNCAIIETPR